MLTDLFMALVALAAAYGGVGLMVAAAIVLLALAILFATVIVVCCCIVSGRSAGN